MTSNTIEYAEVAPDNVLDDAAIDDTVIPEPYNIASYAADYDVE